MCDRGLSLIEVMVAMVIAGIALIGTMGAIQVSSRHAQQGMMKTRALALAQGRLEAKRAVRWNALLQDDLNHDGIVDVTMHDDGEGRDAAAGDGTYTGTWEQDGVSLEWTVALDRPGPLSAAGFAVVRATATYEGFGERTSVQAATVRANPTFVGVR
ncbi:type IV pilus modification PilV family protein [Nitrospira sp. NS4]|uniref:type IV pilus modification PilV family protein n=1 Tax=Nitrospira sp. NS4 TaxID=3414498 RepID=UPI003C2D76AF